MGGGMDGQPIDLLNIHGKRLHRRWRHPGDGPWDIVHAYLGQLPDGRWYVDRTDWRHGNGRAYPDQASAEAAVVEVMADRHEGWVEERVGPPQLSSSTGRPDM